MTTDKNAPQTPAKPASKAATVIKLLGRACGATLGEIGSETGWQPHSTRAFLSGLRKKGDSIEREQRKSGESAYRIVKAKADPAPEPAAAGVEA